MGFCFFKFWLIFLLVASRDDLLNIVYSKEVFENLREKKHPFLKRQSPKYQYGIKVEVFWLKRA